MKRDPLLRFLARPTARRFDVMVEATRSRLLAAASRVLGDLDAAEDVVQEVYVGLLRGRENPPAIRSGIGWLVRSTVWRARTRRRALARMRARDALALASTAGGGADSPFEESVQHAEVRDAVARLAGELRGPAELRYFGGLATREIAEVFDLTPRAVDKRLERARGELASRLTPAGLTALQSGLREEPPVHPGVVAAAQRISGPALREAAGVPLPLHGAPGLVSVACALSVLVAVATGGHALWSSLAPREAAEETPRSSAVAAAQRGKDVFPAARLFGFPVASRSLGAQRPAPPSG